MHLQVWQMYTLQAGSCAGAAGDAGYCRVLPGGMEMQVWQQVVHAMNIIFSKYDVFLLGLIYIVHFIDYKLRQISSL